MARTLREKYRVKVHTVDLDVTRQKDVENVFSSLPAEWQAIDILVNNAGLSRGLDKLQEGKIQDWEEMIDTNVKGLLYVSRAVLPGMLQRNRGPCHQHRIHRRASAVSRRECVLRLQVRGARAQPGDENGSARHAGPRQLG